MIRRSVILGCGGYLPEKIVSNDDLAKTVDTSDEWIVRRTGIKQRHVAARVVAEELADRVPVFCLDDDCLVPVLRVAAENRVGKLVSHKFDELLSHAPLLALCLRRPAELNEAESWVRHRIEPGLYDARSSIAALDLVLQ